MSASLICDVLPFSLNSIENIQLFRKVLVGLAISDFFESDQNQISAEEIMGLIEKDVLRLTSNKRVSKINKYAPVSKEQLPEYFGDTKKFVMLGAIARVEKGKTGIQQAIPGRYPLVVTSAERGVCDHYDFDGSAAIIPLVSSTGHGDASINRLHYQEGKFALGTILAAVFPYSPDKVSARFLFEYLSLFKDELLVSRMSGTANVSLSIEKIEQVPVPLVSISVQRKLDELLGLCDQLQYEYGLSERNRELFTLSIYDEIRELDENHFIDKLTYAIENLKHLTENCGQINYLRGLILDLAVRGKLVEPQLNCESAEQLIARAKLSKTQLLNKHGLRKDGLPELSSSASRKYAPQHWGWCYLGDFALILGGKRLPPGASFSPTKTDHAYIRVTDMKNGSVSMSSLKYISEDVWEKISKYTINSDDLYITIAGTIGQVGIIPKSLNGQNLTENAAKIVFRDMDKNFLYLVLNSSDVQNQFQEKTKQMAQPKLALKRISGAEIPIPPITEQRLIVSKYYELMSICNDIEAALIESNSYRIKFLESVLHKILLKK